MAPTTSDLYDIAGPVPCHGLATTAIPTLSAPPMTRRAAATAYRTAAVGVTRPRIDKSSLHRQMGLAFRKFDELGDILEAAAERMFYAPTAQGRAANRPSKKRRKQRGGRRQRGVDGRFERATGQDGGEAGEASRVDSGDDGLEYLSKDNTSLSRLGQKIGEEKTEEDTAKSQMRGSEGGRWVATVGRTKRNQRQRHRAEWPSFGEVKPAGEGWRPRLEKAEVRARKAEREAGELRGQLRQAQEQVAEHRLQVQAMQKECRARRRGAQGQGKQAREQGRTGDPSVDPVTTPRIFLNPLTDQTETDDDCTLTETATLRLDIERLTEQLAQSDDEMYKFSVETQDLCEVYNDQISKLEQTVTDMTRQQEDTEAQYRAETQKLRDDFCTVTSKLTAKTKGTGIETQTDSSLCIDTEVQTTVSVLPNRMTLSTETQTDSTGDQEWVSLGEIEGMRRVQKELQDRLQQEEGRRHKVEGEYEEMRKAKDAQQEKARKGRKAAEQLAQERERLRGELRDAQQEVRRLSSEVAAGEQRLDDWDAHIQGHHVAVQKRLLAEVRRLELEAVGVSVTVEDLLAQDVEGPRSYETDDEHVKV